MKSPTISMLLLVAAGFANADIERGRTLYAQVCFNCHGLHLEGGIGPSLKDQYWQHGSSSEAILEVIDKGVPDSEMIAFEAVFPEADRLALRDFIVSEQEGLREVTRSVYPREALSGKRFTPEAFATLEPESRTSLPENWFYMEREQDGVMRGTANLYVRSAGEYRLAMQVVGRTSVFLNGEEVHFSDEAEDKENHINRTVRLEPGVHHLEVFHEEQRQHSYRFHGVLRGPGGLQFPLNGRSLQGNIPKVIKAGPEAQVVRKWIDGVPPRTLLCLLPNSVIVAYDAAEGKVFRAWHSAEINQTPSLPDRSAKPSEVRGVPIGIPVMPDPLGGGGRFLGYECDGVQVRIRLSIDGRERVVTVAPKGKESFTTTIQ